MFIVGIDHDLEAAWATCASRRHPAGASAVARSMTRSA